MVSLYWHAHCYSLDLNNQDGNIKCLDTVLLESGHEKRKKAQAQIF